MNTSDEELRRIAHKRLKSQASFKNYLGIWAAVTVLLVAVWALGGGWGHYFWPIWPIVGMAIAAVFLGLDAYGPGNHITEDRIEAEVRRMRGQQASSYPTGPSHTTAYGQSEPHGYGSGNTSPAAPRQPVQSMPPTGAVPAEEQSIPPQPPLPPMDPDTRD
ncbi:hypothetical protein GCM10027416_32920 [Okibacterium endophyticum]